MSGKKSDLCVRVTRALPLSGGLHLLDFRAPALARAARPGQFVFVKPAEHGLPLLRRAFSVALADPRKGEVSIYFDVKGPGTLALSRLVPGHALNVLGPLGRGFPRGAFKPVNRLVGGGCGLAPLLFLARVLRRLNKAVHFYYGARTRKLLNFLPELKKTCTSLTVATEDGSLGRKGYVVDHVQAGAGDAVFACGPNPMLKAVAAAFPRARVALETEMACGAGVCMGCAVRMRDRTFKRCCVEGPVFNASEIAWDPL
jgi:dihydroorotate dehydrogenase electron transfer subunit